MIAVSNTTPLRYLIAIDQFQVLANLFEKVFIPPAVLHELTDRRTPEQVVRQMSSLPTWLEVRQLRLPHKEGFPVALHKGELEAILLCEEMRADVVLIDEQIGRGIAADRKLPVSGTLGILERADRIGVISDFPRVLYQLRESGFFITQALERQLLDRHLKRKGKRE